MIRVCHLCVSPGHNFLSHHERPPGEHPILEVDQIECVAGQGIRGDRFFGFKPNYRGQITFFSMDVFSRLRRELNLLNAQPSATRRNVFVSGADLGTLVGQEFEIQGVRFAGVEECRPCYWMNSALGPGAEAWLKGRGGLRAQILTSGVLRREPEPVECSAVILAGGESRRMGCDKARLEVDGETFLARAVSRLREIGANEIFISGRPDRDDAALGCPVLLDREPGLGPIGGVERALHAAGSPLLLVLAVDMPQVTAAFLRRLAAGCVGEIGTIPRHAGRIEPLAAFYPKAAWPLLIQLLDGGSSLVPVRDERAAVRGLRAAGKRNSKPPSVTRFAELCVEAGLARFQDVRVEDVPCFANWNSPADLPSLLDQHANLAASQVAALRSQLTSIP